jgi:hypothetical protein
LLNIKRIVKQLASAEAAEIAEAAMVLPLVFMLLLGIVWFGRAFNIYSTITQAAQQGAITAARSSCVTCGNTPTLDTTVEDAVVAVLQSSNLKPGPIMSGPKPTMNACPSPPAPPGGACINTSAHHLWLCRNVQLNPPPAGTGQPPQCGTVVSFQYPFESYLPFTSLNLQSIMMSTQAQSRMEN